MKREKIFGIFMAGFFGGASITGGLVERLWLSSWESGGPLFWVVTGMFVALFGLWAVVEDV